MYRQIYRQVPSDFNKFGWTRLDYKLPLNGLFIVYFGLYWTARDRKMVEAAGIEPASANPPHTGDYMFSLSLF